ncbi:MAG: hypothetical protein V7736_00850 [Colwellia polaris]|jgi:hypothetical protein
MRPENEKNKPVIEASTTSKKDQPSESSQEALDNTWAELTQDWQSQPYEKVDVQALLSQTKKRTFWAKFLLALNILATVCFIFVVIVMWLSNSQDKTTMTYLIFAAVGSVIFVYYEIKIRLIAWQQVSASPDMAVKNAIKGIESSINYIRLTKFSCWFLVPAGSWYVIEMAKQNDKSMWLGLIIMNVSVGVMWGITHLFHRKRKAELAKLKNTA